MAEFDVFVLLLLPKINDNIVMILSLNYQFHLHTYEEIKMKIRIHILILRQVYIVSFLNEYIFRNFYLNC